VESIQNEVLQAAPGPPGIEAVAKKILYYQAKDQAIQDCLFSLRDQENTDLQQSLKLVRRLGKKQFNAFSKKQRLIKAVQTGQLGQF